MNDFQSLHFKSRKEFRSWLESYHHKSSGFWMVFFKKHTQKANITYDEAVEEALCFGWIDSTKKRIDDEKYVFKFTPRTNIKNWSDSNKIRVLKLIENGRMTKAGLSKIDLYLKTGKVDWTVETKPGKPRPPLKTPEFIKKYFKQYQPAWSNFKELAPSYQRNYILWIGDAKREETRRKRLKKSVELLKRNEKLGMK